MSRNRTYTMSLYRGGGWNDADEIEREYAVAYNITPGCPATGPSYASGGEPAEPTEVELLAVTCDGVPFADDSLDDWFVKQIEEHHDWSADADDRADYRYEQMLDRHIECGE